MLCIDKHRFDLVITDYKMSPMDGLQLIAELRRREFAQPIILLSGFAESIGLRPENTGANTVIQKSSNEVATLIRHTNRLLNPKKPAGSSAGKSRPRSTGISK